MATETMNQRRHRANIARTNLRDDLLESYQRVGGVAWLMQLAEDQPKTYAQMLTRLIPTETHTTSVNISVQAMSDDELQRYIATHAPAALGEGGVTLDMPATAQATEVASLADNVVYLEQGTTTGADAAQQDDANDWD